jgi:hypothetical protein
VHRKGSGLGDDLGGVVVASGARSRDHDDEVCVRGGLLHRGDDPGRLVRDDLVPSHLAAGLLGLGGEHERVGVGQLARPQLGADRANLVAGRDHGYDRRPAYGELGHPGRPRGRHVDRPEPMPAGEEELRRAHVLADRADVLVGRGGRAELHLVADLVHVLPHHHGVAAGGHRVAGVHPLVLVRPQPHGCGLAGAHRVRRPHGDAVHGRRVEGRRGAPRPDRLGGHAPDRLVERQRHDLEPAGAARLTARLDPCRECLGGRDVVHERRGAGHRISPAGPRGP